MKEIATVVKTAGKIAFVQIEKKPECDSCKMCAFRGGKSTVKVRAYNTAGAKTGDSVFVQAEKDNRLLASFIVYVVPVLFAAAGLLVGSLCFESELYIALLCLAGLLLGFAIVFLCDRILAKKRGFGMEVVQIINTDREKIVSPQENAAGAENKKDNPEEIENGSDV